MASLVASTLLQLAQSYRHYVITNEKFITNFRVWALVFLAVLLEYNGEIISLDVEYRVPVVCI